MIELRKPDIEGATRLLRESREQCVLCFPPKDRVIAETDNFVVMAGLGPITMGYSLLFPKDHIPSYSRLPSHLWDEFLAAEQRLKSSLEVFAPFVVRYEHGQIGGCLVDGEVGTRHCYHAHRVFVPWHAPLDIEPELPGRKVLLERPRDLEGIEEHYIMCDDKVFVIPDDTTLVSQYMRRWLLRDLGREREHCWAQFPRSDEARDAVTTLRALWESR